MVTGLAISPESLDVALTSASQVTAHTRVMGGTHWVTSGKALAQQRVMPPHSPQPTSLLYSPLVHLPRATREEQ